MIARRTGIDVGRSGRQVVLFLLLLLALGLGMGVYQALAAPASQSVEEGQALFQGKCAACHTIGQGDRVGPDLKGVTTRRDTAWVARFVAAPDQVLTEGDPTATELLDTYKLAMPNLGLTETQVAALIAYLEAQAAGAPEQQPTPVPTTPPPAGDAATGKNLFTGNARLQGGGPPCMACHGIAGLGALGGGALGPDLTSAYASRGDAVVAWPEIYSPMKEIYSAKSLTQEEKVDLLAFFESASVTQRQPQAVGRLALLAVAGALLLLGLAHLTWRRRLRRVRGPMVAQQASTSRETLGG